MRVQAIAIAALISMLVAGAGVHGQQREETASGNAPESDRPVLEEQVNVRLVQMQFLAQDRNGRPVTDLTAAEVSVKERGDKMKVAFLDPFREPDASAATLPDVAMFIDVPGSWVVETSPEQGPLRHIAVVVDIEHDPLTTRDRAMEGAVRFVDEVLRPNDRVAVLSYNGELHQEVSFTNDRDALVNGIRRGFSRSPRPNLTIRRQVENFVRLLEDCVTDPGDFVATGEERCLRDAALEYADEKRPAVLEFLAAIEGVVRLMSGIDGSKSVLAISHGTSVDPSAEISAAVRAVLGNTRQVSELLLYLGFSEGALVEADRVRELAVREGVALHFVDRMTTPSGDVSASRDRSYQPGARPIQSAYEAAQNDMREFAAATGGVFIASTDVMNGLRLAMDMERGTYIVGYYVDGYRSPEELRKVKVSTSRRGVKITHRRGYYLPPPIETIRGGVRVGRPTKSEREVDGGPNRAKVPIQIEIDPRSVGYEQSATDAVGASFTVYVELQTADGQRLTDSYNFLQHAYPIELWDRDAIEPVLVNGWVDLPEGRYRVIAHVRNPLNEGRGTFTRDLRIVSRAEADLGRETPAAPGPPQHPGGGS